MSESYPSWLPMRPPPPAPASTFESSQPSRPRAEDVFAAPHAQEGRKPTPRSVRIVARDAPWREPTGESAETRVPPQPPRASRTYPISSSRPRFKAPNLHLSLLRSPSISMRLQYLFHYVSTFGHLFLQSYFDLNVVFMLLLVVSRPGPSNNPRNWTLGAVVYIACWAFEIFGVFLLYEVIYSFSRRWRTKRPLILPLYLSTPAHKLVGISSYTNFCFFSYIRRSARPPWSSLFILPSPTTVLSPSPSSSQASYPSSTNDTFIDYIAEWCFWRSQNLPTIILLLPRAGLSLSLLFNFSHLSGVTGRDSTYFDSNGALSGYARGILFANSAWAVWRALVFLGSILGLWILSGTACAGLCGPRYRWEEERGQDPDSAEKGSAHSQTELAYPLVSDDYGLGMSDGWSWKQGTRERVREAWEFCLTNTRSGRGYATANVRARTKEHEDEFAGLDEVLAAAGFASPRFPAQAQRSVLNSEFFKPVEGREALSDIIPPVHEAPGAADAYGSQRSRKSDPLRVLPYPFKEFPGGKASESGGAVGKGKEKEKEKETTESGSIPFPSPVPSPEDDVVDDDEEGEEGGEEAGEDDDDVEGEYGEEELDEEERHRTSESMSSLGRPVNTTYPFAIRRSARSLASPSRSAGTPSHRTPNSTSASPSQPHSTPSTRGSRSTPSTRGSRLSRSTYSNMESSDSPRSPRSAASGEEQVLPPPPSHPRRRRRAGTAPAIPLSHLPTPGPSHPSTRARTRTISASGSSNFSRGFDPEPEALYESDEGPGGRVPSPVADGSQEEAEKEDSVGLLSAAPSPKASLRQRASNLSHHRRGNGSRSVSSTSPGPSVGTGSGSGSARSRAQSFIHSLSQRASLGEFGLQQGRSRSGSRSSSAARNESAHSDSPRSTGTRSGSGGSGGSSGGGGGKGSGGGSGSNRASHVGSGSGSASGTGSGRPSGEGAPGIELTFGRPGELVSQQERLEACDAGTSDSPSVYLSAGGGGGESSSSLRHAASEISGTPSEATERLQVVPPSEASQSRTDVISTADQSFITAPLTVESTTTDSGCGGESSTLTHRLRQHAPEGTWGHDPV